MSVLVTGATGFLGMPLVRRLLSDGASVRVLARSSMKARPLLEQGAQVVVGDVTDPAVLRVALDNVSTVYHLAGKLYTPGVPAADYRALHVDGTRALLGLCQEQAHMTRFIHCSTTGVLGITGEQAADETTPFHPTNAYEETKAEAELLVHAAIRHGFPAVIARPGLVYGPGDLHLLGFFQAIQRRHFRPIGRKPVWLHPIYIDDMTAALALCGQHPRAIGEYFNLAGTEPVTIADLATTIARAQAIAPPLGRIPLPVARAAATVGDLLPSRLKSAAPLTRSRLDFLTHSRVYSVAKARDLLGFAAQTDLTTGITHSVTWYRRHGYLPPVRAA